MVPEGLYSIDYLENVSSGSSEPTVCRPVYPVVGKICPQRRQYPGADRVPGQVHKAVVVVHVRVEVDHHGAEEDAVTTRERVQIRCN